MQSAESGESPQSRANALYWESDRSVNQIADELELSKGMLYGMIRPLPAEMSCPRCASALEFANRTARERRLLSCPACDLVLEEEQARRVQHEASAPTALDPLPSTRGASVDERAVGLGGRDPLLVGAGLLLIAAGFWLFRGLRRR